MTDLSHLFDRYSDDVEADADRLLAADVPAVMPSKYHDALLGLLDDVLMLGSDPRAPIPIRTTITVLRNMRPLAVEELSRVAEDDVRSFFELLHARIGRAMDGQGSAGGKSLIPD